MFDIDLHIIHYKEPKWMLDNCLASVKDQHVNIYIVNGTKEYPPYKGRIEGFSRGSAPFMAFVDPDDEVKPEAFERLLEYSAEYDLIYGNEEVIKNGRFFNIIKSLHHAYIIRRGCVPLADLTLSFNTMRVARELKRRIKHVDEVIYTWNANVAHAYNGMAK